MIMMMSAKPGPIDVHKRLEQSHVALKAYFSPGRKQDSLGNPAQLIVFAEHAVKNGCNDIAQDCTQLYFSLSPPTNQFLIRAHLCEALSGAPCNSAEEDRLSQSLACVAKAVSIAKKSECYYFLVYNASVLLWRICRPFQRPGSRRLFTKALRSVVKALEECKDQDITWRVDLMIGLILSQLDAGLGEEAGKTCSTAIQLARKRAPEKLVELLKLHVSYNLGDSKVFDKEGRSSPEYNALIRLYKVKCAIAQQNLCGEELEQRLSKVFTFITVGDDSVSTGRKTATRLSTPPPPSDTRPPLLIELGTLCIENGLTTLAQGCINAIPLESIQHSAQLLIKKEVLVCQVLVGTAREGYSKAVVETRLQAVNKLDETLRSAIRTNDPDLVQHVCVAQWNICLPLLQANLRHHLLKPLTNVATALEHIDSLLHQMRVCIHFELGKVCADNSQLQTALDHLEKATILDCHCEFSDKITVCQHKVSLRAQMYITPEDPLEQAMKIIEQAGFLSGADSGEDLRSLLIKAGDILAPECFAHTLPRPTLSVSSTKRSHTKTTEGGASKKVGVTKMSHTVRVALEDKGRKLAVYNLAKEQAGEFVKTLDKSKDKQKCRVWADLAKIARKQKIWDVATAAALFCLCYDDERWTISVTKQESMLPERLSSPRLNNRGSPKSSFVLPRRTSSSLLQKSDSQAVTGNSLSDQSVSVESVKREECDLVRVLANTHCLLAECLVYYLQEEGLRLGERPHPSLLAMSPTDLNDDDENWSSFCDWTSKVTEDAICGFLRGAELGCMLGEDWLVASAAAYLWNYNHHWIESGSLTEVVTVFRPLLDSMKQVDMSRESVLLTHISSAVVGGLVQKWTPKPVEATSRVSAAGGGKKGRAESRGGKKVKGGDDHAQLQVDPESGPELNEALEICEYCMSVSGKVPVSVRRNLLTGWVTCKQFLHQPFPNKTFGIEDTGEPFAQNCCALVAVEMISRQGNGIWDFPNCPTLNEVYSLLSECEWGEGLVEMELWVKLAELAIKQKDYNLVCQCTANAITLKRHRLSHDDIGTLAKEKSEKRSEYEVLSLAHCLQGQAFSTTAAGNLAVVRRALDAFTESVRFGHKASSYNQVFKGCHHYWVTCQQLTVDPLERALLRDPMTELLHFCVSLMGGRSKEEEPTDKPACSRRNRDHELVTSMYNTVFKSYMDKESWEEGLLAVEDALWVTPRSLHRHLAEYKLIFKSRMGKNVQGDMIRFQEEPIEFVADLWYKAACNSSNPTETLRAYQNAIDTLQSCAYQWQKVTYLLEFSEWLYSEHFPASDAINQLERIIEILLNIHENETQSTEIQDAPSSMLPHPTPSSTPLTDQSCIVTDVRQLVVLIRAHVMVALLYGRGTTEHQEMSLVAAGFCFRLWKLILESCGCSDVPSSVEDLSMYTLPAQLSEQLKSASGEKGLNKDTVRKPMLTLHYLDELTDSLIFCGLHPLVLLVLNLQMVIAETLIADSKSLCQLLRTRLSSICSELGLHSAASTHSDSVGNQLVDPEDLAKSQLEIEQYRAKKKAVEKEESKRSVSSKPSLSKPKLAELKSSKFLAKKPSVVNTSTLKRRYCIEERVVVRQIWVEKAKIMIRQGQYQCARQLLNQAMPSSQVFDDQRSLLQIHLLLASLALIEKDPHRAIRLLTETQKFSAHLDDWVEGILLLSAVIKSSPYYRDQHKPVLEHALSLLGNLQQRGQSASSSLQHAMATLKARLSLCAINEVLVNGDGSTSQTVDQIRPHSDTVTASANALLGMGYCRDAASIMMDHVDLLRTVANTMASADDRDQYKQYSLEAVSVCEKAVKALQSIYERVKIMCQPSQDVCLPVQRELVQAQLLLADVLMDIFSTHSIETRQTWSRTKEKSSVEKLIEDFVREQPVLSLIQEEWQNTVKLGLEKSLALLSSSHTLTSNNSNLKTKVTASLGRCLHLLSDHTRPDSALQWSTESCTVTDDLSEPIEGEDVEMAPQILSGAKYGALSSVMRQNEAEMAESDESSSLHYLTQACQSLVEAVSVSLSNGQVACAMKAALELVDCCGGFDKVSSSLYLALYQSLAVSQEMSWLLKQVLCDPSGSKLGALLEQNKQLLSFPASSPSDPTLQSNIQELNGFEAYRMLQITENHMELLKQFPSHFRFVVLQHSTDRSQLYAAYLVPPQPPPPAPKKGQPPPPVECLDPVVSCASVSPKEMDSLLEMVEDFQTKNYHKLLKPNLAIDPECQDLFKDALAVMESYLCQTMRPIVDAFRREKVDQEMSVVLLADSTLLRLPLEAMTVLQTKNIHSVARDFSLQMLCHRIGKFTADESIPPAESSKDTKKKGEKYQPQPSTVLANVGSIKYVLDPRKEFESTTTCCEVTRQIQTYSKLTSKWSGYCSGEQVMSIGEWTALLRESSGLLFFGTESFLAHITPASLAPLSLQDCSVALVMDHVHTIQSLLHQSKLDYHKSPLERNLERPVETAMLLSLVGVRCMLANQWDTAVEVNLENVTALLKGLLSEGTTIGDVNWAHVTESLPGSTSEQSQEPLDAGSQFSLKDTKSPEDSAEVLEDTVQEEESSATITTVDFSSKYNCVLYGLPHITLIAPPI